MDLQRLDQERKINLENTKARKRDYALEASMKINGVKSLMKDESNESNESVSKILEDAELIYQFLIKN